MVSASAGSVRGLGSAGIVVCVGLQVMPVARWCPLVPVGARCPLPVGACVHTLWCLRAQQCRTPLYMSVQRGQGGSPCRAHTFESGGRSMCPGVWCPLLQHKTAGILGLLHVEHAGKQCAGYKECTCGARVTGVGALVTALRRTVTQYGACRTWPDPMTGNRSLTNVVDPPPFGAQ